MMRGRPPTDAWRPRDRAGRPCDAPRHDEDPDAASRGGSRAATGSWAATQTMSQLRRVIRRAKLRLDPRRAEERRKDALLDREVSTRQLEDGLASLTLTHSAEV